MLARALARRGHAAEAVVALAEAVAGDPGAWVAAALADPALAAVRAHLDELRAGYEAAIGEAIAAGGIVRSAGELFAYDGRTARWLRLTHTDEGGAATRGEVTAALVVTAARVIVQVTEGAGPRPVQAVGVVAPSPAASTAPIAVPGAAALVLACRAAAPAAGVWVGIGTPLRWSALVGGRLVPLAAKATRPPGPRVELVAGRARRVAGAVAGVSADGDEHARASALRLTASARTVAAPGEACGPSVPEAPGAASSATVGAPEGAPVDAVVHVVEVATGTLTELARGAGGLAPQWLSERRLAIAGPAGLTLVDVEGAAPVVVRDAGLAAPPARPPGCERASAGPAAASASAPR